MENLQGNFQKTVKTCMLPQPAKRPGRWTLLLVEDCGRSIHIRWCNAWIVLALLLFAAASGTAVFCYCMYHTVLAENRSLRALADEADKQRMLLAQNRHLPAEADREAEKVVTVPLSDTEKTGKPDVSADSDSTGEAVPPSSPEETAEMTAQDKTVDDPVSNAGESASPSVPAARVSVGDFACSFSERHESLDIRFYIRNADPDAGPVSGQVFVMLKPEEESSPKWLLLPDGKTVSGKLPNDAEGKSFSISRFRSVEMKAKAQKKPDSYKTATVIIVDENRNILLETDFPVSGGKSS